MSPEDQKNTVPSRAEIESLFVNNACVDEIGAYIGRFNPIKIMGVEQKEITHSNILGWLLNPQENHGLGDTFLKAFLSEALRDPRNTHRPSRPSALDVSQADLKDAEIKREWNRIDLFIHSPKNGWVFVIENKFRSEQGPNQLKQYMDAVEERFKDVGVEVRGVFLTLWEEEPNDKRYSSVRYSSIRDILEQQILCGRHPLTAEVKVFLQHYLEIIKEKTEMSENQDEMEKSAYKFYREHKRVLDFIFEHGKITDFQFACKNVFGRDLKSADKLKSKLKAENQEFRYINSSAQWISFLPEDWFDALDPKVHDWHVKESWMKNLPLVMWIEFKEEKEWIELSLVVRELKNFDLENKLIKEIQNVENKEDFKHIKFLEKGDKHGPSVSTILSEKSFPVNDIHDYEQIAKAIKEALKLESFKPEIDAISEVLTQFAESIQN